MTTKQSGEQISGYTAQTSILDTDNFVLEDTVANLTKKTLWSTIKSVLKTYFDTLYASISVESNPVGTIIEHDTDNADTPALSSSWAECNGQKISDADSVYNGKRVRNLNGEDVVLTLTWTADAGGAYASPDSADLPALAVGDDVSGSGIDSGTTITDITAGVVTISDVTHSGSTSTTFSNRGRFTRAGETSGIGENDAMQRITGEWEAANNGPWSNGASSGAMTHVQGTLTGFNSTAANSNVKMEFDSANSTSPNTAKTDDDETRPIYLAMRKYIKIK